jgi:hypothetical protein
MSMNIVITATRKITFKKKNGKRSGAVQTIKFNAWQTPTVVTRAILASKDPKAVYLKWIEENCSSGYRIPVYADDDFLEEGEPISTRIYNPGQEHAEEFMQWCENAEEEGYTIKFEEI